MGKKSKSTSKSDAVVDAGDNGKKTEAAASTKSVEVVDNEVFDMIVKDVDGKQFPYVRLGVFDEDGVLRGKLVSREKFLSAAHGSGVGVCDVVLGWDCNDAPYDNAKLTGEQTGYPDRLCPIDRSTGRFVPYWPSITEAKQQQQQQQQQQGGFARRLPFFIMDFDPLPVDGRTALKSMIQRCQTKHGLKPMFGAEFEFFCYKETIESLYQKNFTNLTPLSPGNGGYSVTQMSWYKDYFQAILELMPAFGVNLEGFHAETGPGVLEAALRYADALSMADQAALFKSAAKEIGSQLGVTPCFMAKVSEDLAGSSGHLHQSLWTSDGKNAFYDESDSEGLSALFRHFLAGQVHLICDFLPLLMPTVNSYKRQVEGYWAPTHATWGMENRLASFRVLLGGPKATRVECRVGGADINPYMAIAACLAMGMYGIEQKLELPAPVTGASSASKGAIPLPRSLAEATDRFDKSAVARQFFGDQFVDHMVSTRRWEVKKYSLAVTDWERKRYFEVI